MLTLCEHFLIRPTNNLSHPANRSQIALKPSEPSSINPPQNKTMTQNKKKTEVLLMNNKSLQLLKQCLRYKQSIILAFRILKIGEKRDKIF